MMNKHYHFIGIGGIGMGAIAKLVLSKGNRVSGSDLNENILTGQLKDQGAIIYKGHHREHVAHPDCVVISSAIKENNCELMMAREKKIPIKKRAEILAELMEGEIGITVAGAHGKTTTTSMISHMLETAGLGPTTAIGGIVNSHMTNASLGSGNYFVSEADESDGSFLCFQPEYSIITNIDLEHIDFYQGWDMLLKTYKTFMEQTKKTGFVIGCGDDERLKKMIETSDVKSVTYGYKQENDLKADNLKKQGLCVSFDCSYKGKRLGEVLLNVPGNHNVLNALACIALGLKLNIPFDVIVKSLKEYSGVRRRFQILDSDNNVTVVDDYAHHPAEVTATLETAKQLAQGRVISVFQPHRYSRFSFFFDQFAETLSQSDILLVTDIYSANEVPLEGVNVENFVKKVEALAAIPVYYVKKECISQKLFSLVTKGDIVLFLGAGDISKMAHHYAQSLKQSQKT